ncbi:hypothetical protein KsCSTR_12780 [Candidatus Kuenenia stuttgartiensis]|uniref:Uncharacterized protein n=1 Tax=Kuenenia stuttgartiensis TaxID=174633 RepID=Q1Q0U1_KUEST|nr:MULTISPECIES: hypothetical protein [Kuenenia]MBE7545592.1 hypothetical protein [Planctomycetia bacterium]MBZ0191616.1 hypothetical protein [Candidatus Kuenenia stuttgartiensis]MCF6151952.1 hypothetical protein [Candidatus Kuenenia stuttgartiensis]MCL4728761.1 hypothetical protein [Candidatus Kuenenia stuttgartiensis]MCZ7624411.1 hypothetical protein [Candidatus Kuenenia sp.]
MLIRNLDDIGHKQSELVTTWISERMKNTHVVANNPLMAKCAKSTRRDKDYADVDQHLKVVKSEYVLKSVLVRNDKGKDLSIFITNIWLLSLSKHRY